MADMRDCGAHATPTPIYQWWVCMFVPASATPSSSPSQTLRCADISKIFNGIMIIMLSDANAQS